MPRVGGIFTLPPGYFAVSGEIIQPSQHNPPLEDIAEALTQSLPRDGTAGMTGNLPMGGNRITGIAAATAPGHVPRYDQVLPISGGTVSGSLTVTGEFTAMGATRLGTDGLVRVVRNTGSGTNYIQSGETAVGDSSSPLRFGPYSSATYYLEISDSAITANGVPFTGSGAGLTNLPAASLTGTIADARLPSTVVRTTGAQTISGNKTLTGSTALSGPTSVTGNFVVDASTSAFAFDADAGGRNAIAFRRNSSNTVVARIESNNNLSFNTFGGASVQVDGDTIVTQGRTLTAGDGLSGGGNLSANRTLSVDSTVVRTSRTLTAGTGLSGLGDLSANRTVNLALGSLSFVSGAMTEPRVIVVDGTNSGSQGRMAPAGFRSNFDLAAASEAFGIGQSWVAPSRSTNTIYQNTTGRPIMVNVEAYNCVYQVSTTGSGGWVWVGRSHTNTDGQQTQSFVVPNGHYYRAVLQGGIEAIHNWSELR